MKQIFKKKNSNYRLQTYRIKVFNTFLKFLISKIKILVFFLLPLQIPLGTVFS